MTGATLVVGLGRSDRGDDGVGPAVARSVATRPDAATGLLVCTQEDPTALLDLWEGHDHVVVIDAVVTGAPAGTLHRLELGADAPPLPSGTWAETGRAGTHAFGLAATVELGRALHRLPATVVVVGVEAGCLEIGTTLSPPVAAAVAAADELVGRELAGHVPG
ncbi:hydrogenase maturation protease [Nocardioides cynanchi]|uniref:hydrogenase maturation protease n=1 Tax=Nocardioides cynanchi TaxID=2558918 RepID=UPI0017844F24|nr:hydrogenase maturation protease [Nocardioides cynanchi]